MAPERTSLPFMLVAPVLFISCTLLLFNSNVSTRVSSAARSSTVMFILAELQVAFSVIFTSSNFKDAPSSASSFLATLLITLPMVRSGFPNSGTIDIFPCS